MLFRSLVAHLPWAQGVASSNPAAPTIQVYEVLRENALVARIYKPSRSAMQSGDAKSENWLLEFESEAPRTTDPLMGWTSSGDTRQQLKLKFETKELAIAYAERNGLAYVVAKEPPERLHKKSYSDNFKWGRTENWTH